MFRCLDVAFDCIDSLSLPFHLRHTVVYFLNASSLKVLNNILWEIKTLTFVDDYVAFFLPETLLAPNVTNSIPVADPN